MTEPEIDDVAFLTGDPDKRQGLFNENQHTEKLRPLVCSKGQALCVTSVILAVLVTISLIAAFARPFPRCSILHDENGHPLSASSLASSTSHPIPTAITGEIFAWNDVRLPSFIRPLHYSLFMHPNLTTFVNRGSVNITFIVTKETEFIVLHMKEMAIQHLSVSNEEGEDVRVISYLEYPPHEQLYVEFVQSLEPEENYTLTVDFSKELEEKLEGFYISSYNTARGEKRYVATTHFEATFARSAFPCFDEPALKATFQLRIVHDNHHDAYFNSEKIAEVDYDENQKLSIFDRTVRMSTYLVAFVVCDFKSIGKTSSDGIEVQVLAPSEQLEQARFALETAVDILEYFQDFFNVTYPLKKLDLIAVPDFGPGAMENWGFITFRTAAVLFDPQQSSITSKENIATIIAHELAHQWFGNLVTMEWWNDLWLNEGFASFMENFGVDFIRPEWKMMDQFILFTTQDALSLDSLESTHPILEDVKNPTEIEAIFDTISYKKGSSIIFMLENFLGTDLLREGLTLYLNRYRFQNAETEDLWNAFSEVTPASAHLNVAAIMKTWTEQKGFPLVNVAVSYRRIQLGQCRFLITTPEEDDAEEKDISPFGYKWYIPVTYITNEMEDSKLFWLNMTDGEFQLREHAAWVKVNVNQTGFYRVMYDEENWKNLIGALHEDHMQLSAADRSSLIDDAMVLARVGILNSNLAMDLTQYLKREQDYVPWETAILHFDALRSLMEESPKYHLLKKYVLKLLNPLVEMVGWADEGSHLKRKLRSSVLSAALRFGDEEIIKEALEMFDKWKADGIQVPPNLRHVVYTAGVKHGVLENWQFCWDQYLNSQIPSEKHLLLMALGHTRDIWQLTQYLSAVLQKEKIRPQDVPSVITVVAHNPIGHLLTWRFVRNHWPDLLEMFGETSFSLDVIISETVAHFQTKFDYDEVRSFFGQVHTGTGALSVKQSLEKIHANIRWHAEVQPDVLQWLQKHVH